MHEDDLVRGAALRPSDLRDNVALLQDLGATMTRAHYPLHPLTLELADREGILVWAEVPGLPDGGPRCSRTTRVRRRSLRILREMVLRDRNHPSVVVWSVGNENTSKPGAGFRRYVRQAKRAAKRLDPTRLVGLAFPGYPTIGRQSLYASLDALGVNDYFGWYPGPNDSIADRADLGPYLDKLHSDYPRQALFVTEFGAEANRSGPATREGNVRVPARLPRLPPERLRPEGLPQRRAGMDPARLPGQAELRRRKPAAHPAASTKRASWTTRGIASPVSRQSSKGYGL